MRRVFVVALMATVVACGRGDPEPASEGAAAKTVRSGVLTVGSDIAYAPFESVSQTTQKPEGFDIDLMTEIGKRLDLRTEFVNQTFAGIIPGLLAKKYDAIASAMTITDERKKQVSFSDPYFNADQSLVVNAKRTADITSTDDLGGKSVGVQAGTTGETWANENLKGKAQTIKAYETADDAFLDLKAGKIEAIVNDNPVNLYRQKQDADFKVVQTIKTDEKYGIAMHPDADDLVSAVNGALEKIRDDGAYDRIYERWFGTKPSGS